MWTSMVLYGVTSSQVEGWSMVQSAELVKPWPAVEMDGAGRRAEPIPTSSQTDHMYLCALCSQLGMRFSGSICIMVIGRS